MVYLLLAIASSAMVSIVMSLGTHRVKQNVGMLAVNYLVCTLVAALYAGFDTLLPAVPSLPQTLGLGAVNGALYLSGFVLLQYNIQKNGVVISSVFMKLGLLVPMAVSVLAFGEQPGVLQIIGFVLAIAAIVLINSGKEKSAVRSGISLLLLLLGGGCCDVMAKIFEELGDSALSDQFLLYTFVAAFLLCLVLMLVKKQRIGGAELLWGALVGIPNFFSAKFLLGALKSISAVVAYPTYSVATLLVITLAGVLFFKEKLGRRQWIALGIILAALALLNL